ncbi:pentapeptide repeat-containing protein (plasmid) [Streptomyces sp. Qhu-G9]|uniref:pentapeptide repeat-containing protein n=1 Tax=Streptomyces sp. Qhu-G9 TaxID=3452799 RepID=UPI0022ABD226|nr:pentapeptide repeat-containing protein [Streptomyces aurantiacus]WAU78396.1 pentapeptide repeat-containing protein [Streptomyces aurantiacus]
MGQASKELRISEQGQITNRYNAAITNLGSESVDVRLGGIYALQRIMQDSSRDHPTVVSVLAAYVRQHARLPASGTEPTQTKPTEHSAPTDIQAAMNVLADRLPGRDKGTAIDMNRTDLRGVKFRFIKGRSLDLRGAVFSEADLRGAAMANSDLREAQLDGADLREAQLFLTNLAGAYLSEADLTDAFICVELTATGVTEKSEHACADLEGATMEGVTLTGADLTRAKLARAKLTNADLANAVLTGADLTGADLTGADLTGVKLDGAKLDGVRGLPPSRR